VTKLSPVGGRNPKELACLHELLKRLQDGHGEFAQAVAEKDAADAASSTTVSPDTPNVLQTIMQLEQVTFRAETANKIALEEEKESDVPDTGKITSVMLVAQHTKSDDHQHPLSFLHARTSCHVFLLFFLVYRGTMRGGRSTVGTHHVHVCVVEDTDPTPVDQISWWKVLRVLSRPFGQKTNLLSQYHQGFGIVT
jgi:hypothetical protein